MTILEGEDVNGFFLENFSKLKRDSTYTPGHLRNLRPGGDMLDAVAECDSAITARVRSALRTFRECSQILIEKGYLLKLGV